MKCPIEQSKDEPFILDIVDKSYYRCQTTSGISFRLIFMNVNCNVTVTRWPLSRYHWSRIPMNSLRLFNWNKIKQQQWPMMNTNNCVFVLTCFDRFECCITHSCVTSVVPFHENLISLNTGRRRCAHAFTKYHAKHIEYDRWNITNLNVLVANGMNRW
jgi:hypothetical protein